MASLRRAIAFTLPRILNSTPKTSVSISPISSPILHRSFLSSFSRLYSSKECNSQSLDIDLSNEETKRRLFNRLLYRSKQRGFLELDLILGKWVEDHINSLDENGIKALVHVLDVKVRLTGFSTIKSKSFLGATQAKLVLVTTRFPVQLTV
ncbi:PREDICTED: succinate dehydrogenase assembly factor 2, mitochondrial-like isoform X2 [Ipomoea nil]|uniref:succinate dehydrogenase assembly factor 2, mitochondrial-like isoform X2 n=1 Tax=Ipomoea nil TaxID=35883 RepID=UPI00090126D9|nr:PREDICTED: succinate dehydrogenase assembly factor 2, mitochondrial-like isoform X2 [Ipomoea nil]